MTLYHGSMIAHSFDSRGQLEDGTFLSPDKNFAFDYGDYLYKIEIKNDLKLFDTVSTIQAEELFRTFKSLVYDTEDDETTIDNPEELTNCSDNWEIIERNPNVIAWIRSQYDGVWVTEGGYKNLLIFSPVKQKIKSIELICGDNLIPNKYNKEL